MLRKQHLTTIAILVAFYSIGLCVACFWNCDPLNLIVDTADLSDVPAYYGVFSNLGIILWIASASVCIFAALSGIHGNRQRIHFLSAGGILSLALGVDDFFLIHDKVIPQSICYVAYAFLALLILIRFRHEILDVDFLTFLLAGSCLAASIFVDVIQNRLPISYSLAQVFEEGFKFIGICMWFQFWTKASLPLTRKENPWAPSKAI
ncbi:MAG: hypothetical protein Tsb009_18810 [Planctomycetaceae bacterium]